MTTLDTPTLRSGIERIADALEAHAQELTEADARLGDGDLGVTLARAAQASREAAPALPSDVGQAFMQCAQVFMRVSSSSYGTLVATGLMSAAKASKGRTEVPWSEISALLGAALEAMMKRGRGELGQKTVLDSLEAARLATAGATDAQKILIAAREAVTTALEEFRPRTCGLGRARMYTDKSAGLDDPGMLAFKVIVDAL
ncbi:MAG: dihydroxyacetone kinase subunit L [Gammaproteobacteria bacterium]